MYELKRTGERWPKKDRSSRYIRIPESDNQIIDLNDNNIIRFATEIYWAGVHDLQDKSSIALSLTWTLPEISNAVWTELKPIMDKFYEHKQSLKNAISAYNELDRSAFIAECEHVQGIFSKFQK